MKPTSEPVLAETPDLHGAYPRLTDAQIGALARHGHRRPTRRGQVLAAAGEPVDTFYVILRGKVAVTEEQENGRQVIRVHGPRRFLGELGLLEGQVSFVTMEVREPGSVLAVPVKSLREVIAHDGILGDLILRACLIRRSLLVGQGTGFRIIGSCYSPDTMRLREFAARNLLPHRWLDPEHDPQAENLLRRFGVAAEDTPVVIWRGRELLRNPSNAELARLIGLPAGVNGAAVADLLVVGAGPAGLAAAVYGASDGLDTWLLDSVAAGGQAATSSRIENYLGFPSGISGAEFAERAVLQAEKFDAKLRVPAAAGGIEPDRGYYRIHTDGGAAVAARAVVIATGVRYQRLSAANLVRFEGKSVYYAATLLEAQSCGARPAAVVGGGNSAGQAALFLAEHVSQVNLLIRGPDLGRHMSRYLVDQIERNPRIQVRSETEVRELRGGTELESVVVQHQATKRREVIPAHALFVFIGAKPCTGWLPVNVATDDHGFVRTGSDVCPDGEEAWGGDVWRLADRPPLPLETSLPGVFAVGDVRSGSVKRVISAAGEGAMAVRMAFDHLCS